MAMKDTYQLNLTGDDSQLKKQLQEVEAYLKRIGKENPSKNLDTYNQKLERAVQLYKELQNIQSKNKNNTEIISTKDMNEAMEKTKELKGHLQDVNRVIKQGAMKTQMQGGDASGMIKTYQNVEKTIKRTNRTRDSLTRRKATRDPQVTQAIRDMEQLNKITQEARKSQENIARNQRNQTYYRSLESRTRNQLKRSESDGRLSHGQGRDVASSINQAGSAKEEIRRNEERRKELLNQEKKYNKQSKSLRDKYSDGRISRQDYVKQSAEMEVTRKARLKEIESIEKTTRAMNSSADYLNGKAKTEFAGRRVENGRHTFARQVQERAPSIASHTIMAGMGAVAGQYAIGRSANKQNRPYTVAMGQSMGENDYTNIRRDITNASIDNGLGYDSGEMVKMASGYMNATGDTNRNSVVSSTKALAEGGRSLGIADQEAYQSSMNDIMHTGAVSGASQIKDFQDAFYGALKNSGMKGRSEEQLKALTSIASNVGQGRTLGKGDIDNLTAMQGTFAKTGSKAMQGEQGANLMNGLYNGMQGVADNASVRTVMGYGSEYQGIGGKWQMRKDLNDPSKLASNVNKMMGATDSQVDLGTNSGKEVLYERLKSMGVDASPEQVEELTKLYQNGDLTDKKMKKVLNEDKKDGKKGREKNKDDYTDSKEGKSDNAEARLKDQAEALYENTSAVRIATGAIAGLNPLLFQTAVGLTALIGALAKSGAMMGGSTILKKGLSKFDKTGAEMTGGGTTRGKTSRRQRVKDAFKSAKSDPKGTMKRGATKARGIGSDLSSGIGGLFSMGADIATGKRGTPQQSEYTGFGKTGEKVRGLGSKVKNLGSKGKGKLGGLFKGKGKFGGLFKGGKNSGIIEKAGKLGKFGRLGGGALSALSIVPALFSGDSNAIGGAVGSTAGGTVGASVGATLGSIVPGVGTAIGGVLGGMAGSWLGGKTGESVGGLFKGGKEGKENRKKAGIYNKKPTSYKDFGLAGQAWHTVSGWFGGDEDKPNGKAGKGGGGQGLKSADNKKKKMTAEQLREKNINRETANLKVYKSLLERFEQDLQDAKSLDSGGDSDGGSDDGTSASDIGGSGAKKIYSFLKKKGLSDEQVAGIMGNLQQESNLDPNAKNSSSGAFGIAQWLGDRKTGLDNFAKKKGKKSNDLDVQLDYLWHEMNTSEKGSLGRFNKAKTVEDATKYWATDFERMGAGEAMMDTRLSNAKKFKKKYGGSGKGGRGGNSLTNPMLNSTLSTASQPVNNNNNITVNVNVKGGNSNQETADTIADKLEGLFQDVSIFQNQYKRV